MTKVREKIKHRYFPFRRKREENPYEALQRLDKKLDAAQKERTYWTTKVSLHAIHFVKELDGEIKSLLAAKSEFSREIQERHESLLSLKPHIVHIVEEARNEL